MTGLYLNLGGSLMDLSTPKVMGIMNMTPDSFYSGSRTPDRATALTRARQLVAEGADIIDIGGYSSRSGAADVSPEEEYRRLALGIEAVREASPLIPLSIDTFRADVARRCIDAYGIQIVNDIGGGTLDPGLWDVVAEKRVAYVLMHMRGTPADMQTLTGYPRGVVAEVVADLARKAYELRRRGVADVILDPGFGFAKTLEQNYELLAKLQEFTRLGMPLLAGVSRKSMVFRLLGVSPEEAADGTTAVQTIALMKGANILRVHDVARARQAVAIVNETNKFTPPTNFDLC